MSSVAEQQLTAIGGSHHNENSAFCRSCGEQLQDRLNVRIYNIMGKVHKELSM